MFIISAIFINNNTNNSTVLVDNDIYEDNLNQTVNKENNNNNSSNSNTSNNNGKIDDVLKEELNKVEDKKPFKEEKIKDTVTFTYLGEIMMGGAVTDNLSYMYNTAFKKIYSLTRYSDYTYTSLATNITSLDKIQSAKSKYIVTKDVLSAFNSLGIDGVSVATDYMTDYSKTIFNSTIKQLSNNNLNIAGLSDSIVYFESNNKKIAIISATNSYLNNKQTYIDYGINIYSKKIMEADIIKAKENADFVIVDFHFGKSNVDTITYEMADIAMHAIDSGADLVLGAHSLGAKGVIMYETKHIVYSAGYLITDSNIEEAKKSYIYNFNINKDNKIDQIQMIPTYTKDKLEVIPYCEYNKKDSKKYMDLTIKEMFKYKLESKIEDDTIIINLPQDTTY